MHTRGRGLQQRIVRLRHRPSPRGQYIRPVRLSYLASRILHPALPPLPRCSSTPCLHIAYKGVSCPSAYVWCDAKPRVLARNACAHALPHAHAMAVASRATSRTAHQRHASSTANVRLPALAITRLKPPSASAGACFLCMCACMCECERVGLGKRQAACMPRQQMPASSVWRRQQMPAMQQPDTQHAARSSSPRALSI